MNRLPPTAATRSVRRCGGAALVGLVAALIIGILGMHALASHGAATAVGSSAVTAHEAAMDAGTSHAGHDHDMTSPGSVAADQPGHHSGHGLAGMVMLCAAVLLAAVGVLALLGLWASRALRLGAFRLPALLAPVRRVVRRTGPPYVWQFSVIRC